MRVSANHDHRVAVYGHERVTAHLSALAARGAAGGAYLLTGRTGVGKRTVARFFAQALLCEAAPDTRPCGNCRTCRLVAEGACPDLHLLAPPLRIDDVRELQHDLALAPTERSHRVAIVPEVELASAGAANSLLKTLEEPPPHAVLVLTSVRPGEVLPTVRSRCRRLPLWPLPTPEVRDLLVEHWSADGPTGELLARLSGGGLGWAVRALEDSALLEARTRWLDALDTALGAGRAERIELAGELAGDRDGREDGLAAWGTWWRDVLLLQHGVGRSVVNRDRTAALEAAAARLAPDEVLETLRAIETAFGRLASNANARLTLEVLVLALPRERAVERMP